MFSHIMVGGNDLDRSKKFYDAVLGTLGAGPAMVDGHRIFYITPTGIFSVSQPIDGEPATHGNGTMIALVVDSKDKVDALYLKAIELGGSDEGPPGPRGEGFYAAYFRDLDGNKLNFFCVG